MSDSQEQPWSNNPNAPKIPHLVYLAEKNLFAGTLISAILYGTHKQPPSTRPFVHAHNFFIRSILGILTVLFFKCMAALFNPIYRRGEGIKWGLVSYTVIMFSLATVHLTTDLHALSISYIDNRDFAGSFEGEELYGPYAYQEAINYKAIAIIPGVAFRLNNWLADGLLVGSFFYAVHSSMCLTPTLALSLLPILLHESLGHRLSLPHVPRLCGCVFEFSTIAGDAQS